MKPFPNPLKVSKTQYPLEIHKIKLICRFTGSLGSFEIIKFYESKLASLKTVIALFVKFLKNNTKFV